jgi:hypothetical protein
MGSSTGLRLGPVVGQFGGRGIIIEFIIMSKTERPAFSFSFKYNPMRAPVGSAGKLRMVVKRHNGKFTAMALTAAPSLRSLYLLMLILRRYWRLGFYRSPFFASGLSLCSGFFFATGAVNQAWLMIHSCAPFLEENLPK